MPSSQRFGFILRDRNQNSVVCQKNLKPLVKDHHHHCNNLVDSWIQTQYKKKNEINRIPLPEKPIVRKSRVLVSPSNSPKKSEESKRNNDHGASSLVEIWEARLKRSNVGNPPNSNQSTTANSSRSNSGFSVQDSLGDYELVDVPETAEVKNCDPAVEIESGSYGSGSDSDSGESKWGRVADLIRRLSNEEKLPAGDNGGCGRGGLSIIKTPKPCIYSSEKYKLPVVNFSPRIRGRQAFNDLLMQMERDRHRELDSLLERKAVSKFSQRGRLQSMLRLRSLKLCLAIQDRSRSNQKTNGLNRTVSGSVVLHLREKYRANAVNTDKRKDHHQSAETNKETKATIESTRLMKGTVTLEASLAEGLSLHNRKIEEATLCKEEETVNGTAKPNMNFLQLQETIEVEETCCNDGETEKIEEQGREDRLRKSQSETEMKNCMQETQTQDVVHESNEMDQCLEEQEKSFLNCWEEQEEYEDEQCYYGEMNSEWLSEISRPRSYWEELRKSRYLEVMNTRSEKEDIRKLLERRTVTDFLESGLREQIDRLMMSRVQTHSNKPSDKWELQQEEREDDHNETEEEEPLTEGEEHDDRDDSSRSSCSQMFASSPAGSWSSQDTEVVSTPVISVHNPHSPVTETDLLSCMRSQIQQLQQEMSLLRDSVRMCLDANTSLLQQSVQQQTPLRSKCCACNETQVEAVLYKCGHMCMCLKCANELLWSGGKCPICRAQIMDVVRVFFDTRN